MKVYVLYDDPFDDGWNVYGVFSSQEKVDKAIEEFTSQSKYELNWASFELDDLERFFGVDRSKIFSGYAPFYRELNEETIKYIQWQSITESGLDTFLQDTHRKDNIFLSSALWFSVSANNKDEAVQKANEMLKELIKQPADKLGWKFYERLEQ